MISLLILFLLVAVNLRPFLHNLTKARALGLPYVLTPISEFNLLHQLFYSLTLRLGHLLGVTDQLWFRAFTPVSHVWQAKSSLHYTLGPVFAVVSPGSFSLNIADADLARQVMKCREIGKPAWGYAPLEVFGPNILSTVGSEWILHRRVAGPPFSERVNNVVWKEGLRLATRLLKLWEVGVVENPGRDITTMTLHVLSGAAFGVKVSDPTTTEEMDEAGVFTRVGAPPEGYSLTYRDAVEHLFKNLYHVILIPPWLLRMGPPSWRRSHAAFVDTRNYLRLIMGKARQSDLDRGGNHENLVEALVRSSESESIQGPKTLGLQRPLAEPELLGNAFILTIAGHDTVSRGIEYSILSLAMDPEQQERLFGYLDPALREYRDVDVANWGYEEVHDRLICLEWVALESLRMYPPVVMMPREPGPLGQALELNGKPLFIPPGTTLTIRMVALQFHKAYWGNDVDLFRFERWRDHAIDLTTKPQITRTLRKTTGVKDPVKGSFLAFSEGFRECLGRRFALVELAAVLAVLLRGHRVELATREGETFEMARERARKSIAGSTSIFALGVESPIALRWVPREIK